MDSLGYASRVHNICTFDLLNREPKKLVSLLCWIEFDAGTKPFVLIYEQTCLESRTEVEKITWNLLPHFFLTRKQKYRIIQSPYMQIRVKLFCPSTKTLQNIYIYIPGKSQTRDLSSTTRTITQ